MIDLSYTYALILSLVVFPSLIGTLAFWNPNTSNFLREPRLCTPKTVLFILLQ